MSQHDKQWDASLYDEKHSFVWRYGARVVDLLAPQAGERILDLGCGTGHLTADIAASGAEVVGLDKSADMLEQARRLYPSIQFVLGDGTDFQFEEPFDAVFSNAAIHWMRDQDKVTACIWRALKPGGRFVAELGGRRNIEAIRGALTGALEALQHSVEPDLLARYYPTIGQYATLLEKHRFVVTHASYFERPTSLEGEESGLKNWLEAFADNVLEGLTAGERAQVIISVEESLRPNLYRDGQWFADYRRLRILAIRPDSA
jgi:trans-aconitate methyltransferase